MTDWVGAIEAVRADEVVGRGTCSVIDECYGDGELIELLEREGATTPRAAVRVARQTHQVWHEVAADRAGY